MKRYFIGLIVLAMVLSGLASDFKYASAGAPGLSFEGPQPKRGAVTGGESAGGRQYMTDYDFQQLMKSANDAMGLNQFERAYSIIQPYETYIFGTFDHWSNMARYDWLMVQISDRRGNYKDMLLFLNYIIDATDKTDPNVKHIYQYLQHTDANGKPINVYSHGVALKSSNFSVKQAAQAKMDSLQQLRKPFGSPDPRMKYDNYPRVRYTR